MNSTATKYADRAAAALASGFASEARRKEALSALSAAYDATRREFSDRLLEAFPATGEFPRVERGMAFDELYWGVPMDLHIWKPKVAAKFAAYPEFVADCDALADLRAAIKDALVEPKPVREDHPLLVFARSANVDLAALRDRRVKQYEDALDLGRKLGGLPVSIRRRWCRNYGGTTWVRIDWFLRGERVPFNTIAAAYQRLVDEGVIAED